MIKKSKIKIVLGLILSIQMLASASIAIADEKWSGDIALGYDQSTGNTENSALSVAGQIKRMFARGSALLKGDIYNSSTDNRLDDQKWSVLMRTAFDINEEGRWFFAAEVLTDHDRFADIDVRVTPSAGIGYWIANQEDWKWNVEGQLGYETTNYRSAKEDDNSMVAVLKSYLEKKVFKNGRITQGITVIPSLEGNGTRYKSESEFTNPLNDALDFSLKFIVDYNSEPSDGKENTDTRLVTGIKYSF